MAKLLKGFNPNEHEKMGDFTPIPAGNYLAKITKSEMKETKNNNGHYLQLQFEVIEGDYKGRFLFERLNLQNPNIQTVEIAQKALATICDAAGITGVLEDSEELHGIPMELKVVIKPARAQYGESNEIKGYKAAGSGPASGGTGVAKPPTGGGGAAKTSAAKTPPWNKK